MRSNDFVVDPKAGSVIRYKEVYLEAGWVRTSPKWESTVDGSAQPPHTYGHLTVSMSYNGTKTLVKNLSHRLNGLFPKTTEKDFKKSRHLKARSEKKALRLS